MVSFSIKRKQVLLVSSLLAACAQSSPFIDSSVIVPLPPGGPRPIATYMKSNVNNQFGTAPDMGTLNGPLTTEANLTALHRNQRPEHNTTALTSKDSDSGHHHTSTKSKRQSSDYWIPDLASLDSSPLAPSGYTVYRNVQDYGATGDGTTDDTMAINNAISDGNRCGSGCGSSTTLGAVVYFPAGTYLISTPIIQYFYTQFIGDVNDIPIIRGSANFSGIALIDTDVYIPGGSGAEWYINQNNFFRQIRNFNLDLTYMNATNYDSSQSYMPTGIHWQVAQATSLQNIGINMPTTGDAQNTAVGIFMENGSGGFMSDVTFYGGNVGFVAGSQQFTARSLVFTNCLTAVTTLWDWGFTWSQITITNTYVGFNVSSNSGSTGQGTGSIAVIDSTFNHVEWGITTHAGGDPPAIILDNVVASESPLMVQVSGGATIYQVDATLATIDFWALGYRYLAGNGTGSSVTGVLDPAPVRPSGLVDGSGQYFFQSRPQYETTASSGFVVATDQGVSNDGTGDQTAAINSLLSGNVGTPIFFPGGIYLVQGTVQIPVDSIIVGSSWSQIMGTGSYFEDVDNPQIMVRVGNPGDSGTIQISDMLFTVKGPTAGAVLMEWNVHESTQGSAAMWDSHFRVGGATGTDLQLADCPTGAGVNDNCIAASMLLHVTQTASGYFENVWAWVADHDLDNPADALVTEGTSGTPENVQTQVSIYGARGVLIESQGPCWFYGTASEHSTMYQYQLSGASEIFLGLMQTETPYYQPVPTAPDPFTIGAFAADPDFSTCTTDSCKEAWALRVVDSSDVLIYSAGLYSWFSDYSQDCLADESCQDSIVQVEDSSLIWFFNLFTKGALQAASVFGSTSQSIITNDTTQSGYTTEINIWLPFAGEGGGEGGEGSGNFSNGNIVYVDPGVWTSPNETVGCVPPCTMLLPPVELPTGITVDWPAYGTALYSSSGTVTTTFTTLISLAPFVVTSIGFWPVTIGPDVPDNGVITPIPSITPPSTVITVSSGTAQITVGEITGLSTTVSGGSTVTFDNYTSLAPDWGSTVITVQAMPTIPVPIPPGDTSTTSSGGVAVVTASRSLSWTRSSTGTSPTCTSDCGHGTCVFGCGGGGGGGGGCGLFGCGGGCGLFGCGGGGCGLFGCGGPGWGGPCGPAGCGCSVGCTSPEPPGEGSCDGPDCEEPGEEDCTGDDCECEPTKTVTSCGVLCIETVAPTTTMTGICSTTTCQTTSCGQDTTVTSTSTTTIEEDFTVTVVATDPVWTEDNTAAYATSIYNDVLSWWSMEDAAAAATSTSTTSQQPTTTTPPVNIYTSAIAIAAYTTCVGEADGECAWQFELYTVSPPGLSPSSFSVDGCNAGDAIYTSVVDYLPTTTDIPKLGPFDMNGLTGCYIEDLDGPFGCVDPDATYCTYCLNSDDEQTCGSTGACNEDETASYGTLQICQWA